MKKSDKSLSSPSKLPSKIDLRSFCTPVFNQGNLGSCTANAAAGMLEYWRMRAQSKDGSVSRMFIYKATRDLMQVKGDTGGYIRSAMGSLALFGAPPEKYWDYVEKALDTAPPAFCYAYALNYQALVYYRLDEKIAAAAPQQSTKFNLSRSKEVGGSIGASSPKSKYTTSPLYGMNMQAGQN